MTIGVETPNSTKRLAPEAPSGHLSLAGPWDFLLDPGNDGEKNGWYRPDTRLQWKAITVPGSWQAQGYGLDYHGVGWYRQFLTAPGESGRQLWLQFHGAATRATVWLNGERIGEHLGNWAPFTVSLSDAWNRSGKNVLVVRVEEMPNHFSAGFPKEMGRFAGGDSHFGGLWQNVTMFSTGEVQLSDLFAAPRLTEQAAQVRVELRTRISCDARVVLNVTDPDGKPVTRRGEHHVALSAPDTGKWSDPQVTDLSLNIPDPDVWSPQSPRLYTLAAETYVGNQLMDRRQVRFGMRSVECRGTQILLNGKPLMVRGVLHWAYYPDLLNIDPSEERIRREFQDLRAAGFNLVKVCLFVFPRRFYEIADETGMLLWQEYPTWLYVHFPQAGDTRLDADFAREYPEWFRLDRNHPSIILRDLTCEAHNNPNWDLLERTYRTGKELTSGALICDNSSFFAHHITDWYVCHTYRDLDDYYRYFTELVGQMRAKPDKKPFLFGEDFDADTYRDSEAIRGRLMRDGTPWWLKNPNFEGQLQFDEKLRSRLGSAAPRRLVEMQKRHAFALRKAYIEEFRRYPEPAGFVMTSLRDNTATRPGFYDDLMEPKWSAAQWRPFNADTVLLLHAERRSRCFGADEPIRAEVILSNYGEDAERVPLRWTLACGDQTVAGGEREVSLARGQIETVAKVDIALSGSLAPITSPVMCRLVAELGPAGQALTRNEWNVWVFPADGRATTAAGIQFYAYSPARESRFVADYPGIQLPAVTPASNGEWLESETSKSIDHLTQPDVVLVTDTLDDRVRAAVQAGAAVVYLPAWDDSSVYKRIDAPFWRETAIWLPEGPAMGDFPNEGFVDLQFLDMTQRKPFAPGDARDDVQPLIWGVNARNPGAGPYDYVLETRMGKGRVIACCLNLAGADNVAGRHFLRCLAQYVARQRMAARDSGTPPPGKSVMKAPRNMPVHEFIKQQLRRKIERGDLSEGDLLPSENDLARQFEVSRSLARQALRELEIEGYITRSQGARSRVAPRPGPRGEVNFQQARILALAFIGVQSRYTGGIVDSFSRQALEQGYHVLTYNLWLGNEEQVQFLRALRQGGLAGLALGLWQDCSSEPLRSLMCEFIESSFPVVQIDRHIPDLEGGDFVGSDNRAIGEWLTSSLVARGHRRICFLADSLQTTSVQERLDGYRGALAAGALRFEEGLVLALDRPGQRTAGSAIRRILQSPDAPTAFLCVNEYLLSQLHESLGMSARDLCTKFGIAVVDDSQLAERLKLPVLKAVQPAEQIGAESAQCLIARITEPCRPPQSRQLDAAFVDRVDAPPEPSPSGDQLATDQP